RAVGGDITVYAPLGRFGEYVDGPVRGSRPRPVLDIDKEEELVLHARDRQGTAQVAAEIVLADFGPDLAPRVAEECIGVQSIVAQLVEQAAMILAGSALGGEADVHGAAGGGVRARARGGGGDFLNGVDPRRREPEEAGAAALEALRVVVDAVDGDVHRGVGQAVEGAVAGGGGGRLRARHQRRELQRVASGERQRLYEIVADGGRDGVAGCLELSRGAGYLDGLGHLADRELDVDVHRARGFY